MSTVTVPVDVEGKIERLCALPGISWATVGWAIDVGWMVEWGNGSHCWGQVAEGLGLAASLAAAFVAVPKTTEADHAVPLARQMKERPHSRAKLKAFAMGSTL